MKKLFFLAVLTAVSVFSACTKDDVKSSEIVGTWDPVHTVGYDITDGVREDWDEDISAATDETGYTRIEFHDNGKTNSYYYDGGWQLFRSTGTWSLDGNILTITYSYEGETATENATVISVSDNELVLETSEYLDENNSFKETLTYTRVSE